MPVDVMRTIASVGSSMIGSGTVSTRTSRLPCQATAFMSVAPRRSGLVDPGYPSVLRATQRGQPRDTAQRCARVRIFATTAPLASE